MTSIHHVLDLISQVDDWGTLTWHRPSPAIGNLRHTPRRSLLGASPRFARFVNLATSWRERARQRRVLRSLEVRLLGDIGVDRVAAEAEARKPFWRP